MSEETNQNEPQEQVYSPEELAIGTAGVKFLRSTPEFYPCEENGARIEDYLDQMGWAVSVENLTKAFEVLRDAGQLVSRPKSKSERERAQREAEEAAAQAETERQSAEAEAAELQRRRNMPLSDLKKLTRAEISRNQKSPKDGITRTAYPTDKLNAKPRGF